MTDYQQHQRDKAPRVILQTGLFNANICVTFWLSEMKMEKQKGKKRKRCTEQIHKAKKTILRKIVIICSIGHKERFYIIVNNLHILI